MVLADPGGMPERGYIQDLSVYACTPGNEISIRATKSNKLIS
jgi:hypothetical protein